MPNLTLAARDLEFGDIIRLKKDSLMVSEILRRGPASVTIRARSANLPGCPVVERTYPNGKDFTVERWIGEGA